MKVQWQVSHQKIKKIREKEKKLVQFDICCILLLRRPTNNTGLTKNLLKSVLAILLWVVAMKGIIRLVCCGNRQT
jgi:hypothetical protein